jgi:hypothetical protein
MAHNFKMRRLAGTQFDKPAVTVSLGPAVQTAAEALQARARQEADAEQVKIDAARASLAGEITASRATLDEVRVWEKAHAEDIRALRSIPYDELRQVADEQTRLRAARKVQELEARVSSVKATLAAVENRVERLNGRDLVGPRLADVAETVGVKTYQDLEVYAVGKLRHDVKAAIRSAMSLDEALAEAQGAVSALAFDLNKKAASAARHVAMDTHAPTLIRPEDAARMAAGRPGNEQTTADGGDFSGYSEDRKRG